MIMLKESDVDEIVEQLQRWRTECKLRGYSTDKVNKQLAAVEAARRGYPEERAK